MEKITELICPNCGTKNYLNDNGQALYCESCGTLLRTETVMSNTVDNKYGLTDEQLHNEKKLDEAFNLMQIKRDYSASYKIFYDLTENHPEMLNCKAAWFGRILALTDEFNRYKWRINYEEDLDYCSNILNNLDKNYLSMYPEYIGFRKKASLALESVLNQRKKLIDKHDQMIDTEHIRNIKTKIDEAQITAAKRLNLLNKLNFFGSLKKRWIILAYVIWQMVMNQSYKHGLGTLIITVIFFGLVIGKIGFKIQKVRHNNILNTIQEYKNLLKSEESSKNNQVSYIEKDIDKLNWYMVEVV